MLYWLYWQPLAWYFATRWSYILYIQYCICVNDFICVSAMMNIGWSSHTIVCISAKIFNREIVGFIKNVSYLSMSSSVMNIFVQVIVGLECSLSPDYHITRYWFDLRGLGSPQHKNRFQFYEIGIFLSNKILKRCFDSWNLPNMSLCTILLIQDCIDMNVLFWKCHLPSHWAHFTHRDKLKPTQGLGHV